MEDGGDSPSLILVEHHEALRDGLAVLLEGAVSRFSAARPRLPEARR
ncbi:MAG: hypothetical protein ACJ76D_06220 [Solirubrobacterales bacterium]